ncbi:tetratricopeptide repeat protein [Proteobacteria bacterium 005FR1]|nr:tetratricopeptide repeat protein [Proteobacteria bacterium 005FR1]
MKYKKPALLVLSTSLLWGCASVQPSTPVQAEEAVSHAEGQLEATAEPTRDPIAEAVEQLVQVPEPPTRDFPVETFYSLLVAELAGNRGRYDIELGNYIQEAHRTRDTNVTARATRIARYLSANQATLNTARLWVELEPDNVEALYILATELAEDGQLLDAMKQSERLLELGSTPIFQNIAARSGQVTDTQREALLINFDRLLADYPDDLQLLVGKSLLLQQQGKPEEALSEVRKALAIRNDDVPSVVLEARLMYELDQPKQALTRLSTLLGENPNNRRLRIQYARMLANVDLEKALEQFQILVQQTPKDADLRLALALVATQLGDTDVAKESFKRLLELGEQTDSAHFHLGQIDAEAGNSDAALDHFEQVQQGPDFLPALGETLGILVGRGDVAHAQAHMRTVRSRFSSDTEQFYLLEAQILARHQHLDLAEALLTEALTLHPVSTDLLYSRAMINEQRDMIELTESDLRTIIKYQPNNPMALNALGYTLADRTNRYEEAYHLISQAMNIDPQDPAIIDSMGWVQYRLGNYQEAVLRLREAMAAFPDHEIAAHLGEVLWVMGQTKEARKVWAEGLELRPDSDVIQGVMRRLEAGL